MNTYTPVVLRNGSARRCSVMMHTDIDTDVDTDIDTDTREKVKERERKHTHTHTHVCIYMHTPVVLRNGSARK